MKRALLYTGLIALGFISGMRWAHAGEHMMARVERALLEAGYVNAIGYAQLPPPSVVYADTVSGGGWGSYRLGVIEISSRQPTGCIPITLAHETGHDAAVRMGLLDGEPNHSVKAELEKIASIAEAAVDADDYAPNCTMRKSL